MGPKSSVSEGSVLPAATRADQLKASVGVIGRSEQRPAIAAQQRRADRRCDAAIKQQITWRQWLHVQTGPDAQRLANAQRSASKGIGYFEHWRDRPRTREPCNALCNDLLEVMWWQ